MRRRSPRRPPRPVPPTRSAPPGARPPSRVLSEREDGDRGAFAAERAVEVVGLRVLLVDGDERDADPGRLTEAAKLDEQRAADAAAAVRRKHGDVVDEHFGGLLPRERQDVGGQTADDVSVDVRGERPERAPGEKGVEVDVTELRAW